MCISFFQSIRIWDIFEVTMNPEDPQPKQILQDCHADWITDCKWSNIGDFLVNKLMTSPKHLFAETSL